MTKTTSKHRVIDVSVSAEQLKKSSSSSALLIDAMKKQRYTDVEISDEGIITGLTRAGKPFAGKIHGSIVKKLTKFNATSTSNRYRFKPFTFSLTLHAIPDTI